jgi:hypothetical protein
VYALESREEEVMLRWSFGNDVDRHSPARMRCAAGAAQRARNIQGAAAHAQSTAAVESVSRSRYERIAKSVTTKRAPLVTSEQQRRKMSLIYASRLTF